jgi:NAD kinase
MYLGANLDPKGAEQNKWDIQNHHILEEIVIGIGRGPTPTTLEIYINDVFFVKSTGDGIIISTPTGSAGYNFAAGGALV